MPPLKEIPGGLVISFTLGLSTRMSRGSMIRGTASLSSGLPQESRLLQWEGEAQLWECLGGV